jgi:hypothetical protein
MSPANRHEDRGDLWPCDPARTNEPDLLTSKERELLTAPRLTFEDWVKVRRLSPVPDEAVEVVRRRVEEHRLAHPNFESRVTRSWRRTDPRAAKASPGRMAGEIKSGATPLAAG